MPAQQRIQKDDFICLKLAVQDVETVPMKNV